MNKKISNAKIVNIQKTRCITLEGANPKTVKSVLRAAYQGKAFNLGEDKHKDHIVCLEMLTDMR